ncbi:MAG: hypothetical protein EBW55_07900 [Betaproteobacteria bacterium]|nr:hypothetical protein [Betaproteobacteria bacterium]
MVNDVARVLFALEHCEQLTAPNRRIVLSKTILSKRPNPGQRRAQFMSDIACKFPLTLHNPRDAPEQVVDGSGEPLEFLGGPGHRNRLEIALIANVETTLQVSKRFHIRLDGLSEPDRQEEQQDDLRPD